VVVRTAAARIDSQEPAVGPGEVQTGVDAVGRQAGGPALGDAGDLCDGKLVEQGSFGVGVGQGQRPERLGRVADQLGQRLRPSDAHGDGHLDLAPDKVAEGFRCLLEGTAALGDGLEEAFIDGIEFDPWGGLADGLQHQVRKRFVPSKISLEVDALGADSQRHPDRHADGDAGLLHLIRAGNHTGAPVA
jgi:hypothetical protein